MPTDSFLRSIQSKLPINEQRRDFAKKRMVRNLQTRQVSAGINKRDWMNDNRSAEKYT